MQITETRFSAELGVPVALATADEPLPLESLTPGELSALQSLGSATARRHWLLGRAALRTLVQQDTSRLQFPHPELSVSHAGGIAVAVRAAAKLSGIGVDFEPWRAEVHPRMADFFLRPAEQTVAGTARELVRLWTIKEALFKAQPDNDGCVLLDFELADPASNCGTASGPGGSTLHYVSADVGVGALSVAVTPMGGKYVPN